MLKATESIIDGLSNKMKKNPFTKKPKNDTKSFNNPYYGYEKQSTHVNLCRF